MALARDQVDHAADRAGAVQRRHRAANDLDALDIGQRIGAEIECARGVGGVVQRHAVAQHQHLVGVGAADEHAGVAARSAGLADMDARNRGQRVGQRRVAALLDGLAVDDRDAGGNVDDRRRHARRGDDSFGRDLRRARRRARAPRSARAPTVKRNRRHAGPPSTKGRQPACGFTPAAPVHPARGTRAVSTPAGLLARGSSPGPAFSPCGNGMLGPDSPRTVAGAAALPSGMTRGSGFPVSALPPDLSGCGPPASGTTVSYPRVHAMIPRIEFEPTADARRWMASAWSICRGWSPATW